MTEEEALDYLKPVDPVSEAVAIKALLALRDKCGKPLYTVRSLAGRIGRGHDWVNRRHLLSSLPSDELDSLRSGAVSLKETEARLKRGRGYLAWLAKVKADENSYDILSLSEGSAALKSYRYVRLNDMPANDLLKGEVVESSAVDIWGVLVGDSGGQVLAFEEATGQGVELMSLDLALTAVCLAGHRALFKRDVLRRYCAV